MTMPATLALAGAAGVVIAGALARNVRASITAAAGAASLAGTAGIVLTGATYPASDTAATVWALAETACLFVLTLLAVRTARVRPATVAAALSGIAIPAWLLRFGWDSRSAEMIGGFAVWTLFALLAVTVGLYLRALDERRHRSVDEARRAQRDQLARDLHDFVAHDISGMLAQAQAGQILAERDPAAAANAFQRIEASGMKALASMDHSVRMLYGSQEDDDGNPTAAPTLAELPDVVTRFARTGPTDARLEVDPRLRDEDLPRELTTTAHRIVVEALTNVRRHAPTADRVLVDVHPVAAEPGLEVVITDDGNPASSAPARRRGGYGLPGLTERVEALGGTLTAGPIDPTGWRVTAFLPLPEGWGNG